MRKDYTKEPQYQSQISLRDSKGFTRLGLATNLIWHQDPKRLVFILARYKFVAKMLSGMKKVLEVGCGDGFCSRVVRQEVGSVCAIDFDPLFVKDIIQHMDKKWKIDCMMHDMLSGPMKEKFNAAYSLDVIEHIPKAKEGKFVSNIVDSITDEGVLIIGTPPIQSQVYASESSKKGHVNCKDHSQLKKLLKKYFHNVFIFSMNDEVVHTGFYPMAHYLLALCVGKKEQKR